MLKPTGFWSYAKSDDENSRGKLSQLRSLLAAELQQHIGRHPTVNIFQDVWAIPPGSEWERQIRDGLSEASFIVPIITPGFLQSEWCCREVRVFHKKEQELGRDDLIFPIHYFDVERMAQRNKDDFDSEIVEFLRTRQWIDFRPFRLRDPGGDDVALVLERVARAIYDSLVAPEPGATRVAAEARRQRDEAEAAARLEDERRRRVAAEAARDADEEKRRKEAAAAAALRRQEEAEAAQRAEAERLRRTAAEAARAADEEKRRKDAADAAASRQRREAEAAQRLEAERLRKAAAETIREANEKLRYAEAVGREPKAGHETEPVHPDVTIRKMMWRIVPLLMLSYLVASLEFSTNTGSISLSRDLGLATADFASASYLSIAGYLIFALPSTLAFQRFGARWGFAGILIFCGFVSLLFAFVDRVSSFFVLRFLLGAAVAGLFSSVVLCLSTWFPAAYRMRALTAFLVILPVSSPIAAAYSQGILALAGHGWRLLFVSDAILSLLTGALVFFFLPNTPANASWLRVSERKWLLDATGAEMTGGPGSAGNSAWSALYDSRVWLAGLVACALAVATTGLALEQSFFLARGYLLSLARTVLWFTPLAGAILLVWWGYRVARRRESPWHILLPMALAALGLAFSYTDRFTPLPIFMMLGWICSFAVLPVLWSMPAQFLSGKRAAIGIAMIRSLALAVSSLVSIPVGALRDEMGNDIVGFALAAFVLVSSLAVFPLSRQIARFQKER